MSDSQNSQNSDEKLQGSVVQDDTEVRTLSESALQDLNWVKQVLAGDERVYKSFIQKYEHPLQYFVGKMVRDKEMIPDLIQEIFMKAFSNLAGYNPQYAFSTWIYRIATNHTIDFLRKKKLQTYSIDEPVSMKDGEVQVELPDNSFAADKKIQQKERENVVAEAINSLPERYRAVIKMRHMEEKSYQEISEIMDLPLGTVKAHIFRARELLYKYLKDKRGTF